MAESSSVDVILEYLQKNGFARAEAALRSELGSRPDLKGFLQKLSIDDKDSWKLVEDKNGNKCTSEKQRSSSQNSGEISKELIVKEIECGTGKNGFKTKWQTSASIGERDSKPNEEIGVIDSEDTVLDLYSWNFKPTNGSSGAYQNDGGTRAPNFFAKTNMKTGEVKISSEKRSSWNGNASTSTSNPNVELKYERSESKELDQQHKTTLASSTDVIWSRGEVPISSTDLWKDCSVKTVFPFPKMDESTSYDTNSPLEKKKERRKAENSEVRVAIKEQVDEVGRALYLGKSQGSSEPINLSSFDFPHASDNTREEFPRLPPVKLKSEEKLMNVNWQENFEHEGPGAKLGTTDNALFIGSYLDVPVGQEISSSAAKRIAGGSWLSVSQGIAEDTSDLVSGFATVGDGISESIDYPNEYWDSDEYDDDDDDGYTRQPIDDETWFLAHEIDYPSDNEKGTGHGSVPDPQEKDPRKDDDDQSFAEEDSYFSGEQYFLGKSVEPLTVSDDPVGLSVTEMYKRTNESDLMSQYDGQLLDDEEINLMRAEPVWQGFVTQTDELVMLGGGKILNECGGAQLHDICMDDDQRGSVRSIGVGINSDAADIGSEVRESLVGGSSEGDLEYFHDHDVRTGAFRHSHPDSEKKYADILNRDKKRITKHDYKQVVESDKVASTQVKNHTDAGFSFPPPLMDGQVMQAASSKSLWSNNCDAVIDDEADECLNALMGNNDMLASWNRKSSDSSTVKSPRGEMNTNTIRSADSSPSSLSNYGYAEQEHDKKKDDEKTGSVREDPGASLDDKEAAAVQEQVSQIKAQEEEFETFNLKIVHRKNKTGFEEDKNFHVVLNSIIAGRYHVTEYLGSAAFSKAIQAHDLHTGMDVCVKIIKNNKDFFDQSLDEIKLLKYVNKHDPADKYHILRLYDYFYYREHLLIVCELLKANLYEFHKFNRESGGEVYFTMPRLQSITIQCLEALQFLHSLGLIHCDLKPENILVKSYSRCEVKVIDLGSSCFETDHLCSYVQSRSYRAPEVILGLPYDKKIDIWSLGCILAELCTGNVLFQNDSPATLLARVIGIIGPIDQDMLAKGRDTYKYFSKNHMLYQRNQETNRLEYLIPKKTSLRHRLPMGDQGFIDFVAHLLEANPKKRPSASEALKHPWLVYPYEPISA
ncbi:hypothetical protein K2173_007605 [Erythroxylum novogranatense]|uniref:Protein kinase domain-containing protein n=1 Tax=Erythroxylum novogranatense TaxID=1862640 RepID=A0AAV8S8Y3_9ROSI|nr:hypothetical protein K2173_007605 [Erythroxylum novogranatense]